jgi:hypothetical protein
VIVRYVENPPISHAAGARAAAPGVTMDTDNSGVSRQSLDANNSGAAAPRAATHAYVESPGDDQRVETHDEHVMRKANLAATLRILIPVLLILGMIAAGYGRTPEKRADAQSSSNLSRCTLPDGPLGSESTILSTLGALYAPSSRVQ